MGMLVRECVCVCVCAGARARVCARVWVCVWVGVGVDDRMTERVYVDGLRQRMRDRV